MSTTEITTAPAMTTHLAATRQTTDAATLTVSRDQLTPDGHAGDLTHA